MTRSCDCRLARVPVHGRCGGAPQSPSWAVSYAPRSLSICAVSSASLLRRYCQLQRDDFPTSNAFSRLLTRYTCFRPTVVPRYRSARSPLPKSIPPTSAVIKGCWQLSGGHRGDAATDRTTGQKAVDDFKAFVDVGVTTFDSGPEECGYGPSEALVGQFLCTGYGGAAVQANTKLCFVGQEQRSNTIEYVEDKVNRSISRFGRNINLMQLYWCGLGKPPDAHAACSCEQMCRKIAEQRQREHYGE